jgi:Peptidase A4 family
VSAVSGSWVVPTVTGSGSGTTYSAVWVGIDGYSDSTVEQLGTEQDVENGKAVYQAWWEMYSSGDGQPEQVISGMTIKPGDSISASVQYLNSGTHSGQFELSITDSTESETFTTYETSSAVQSPTASRSSAEWIIEAPTVGSGVAALANFGSVTFTNASATIDGVTGPINDSAWQSQAINIATSSGTLQDTTSELTDSGTSFVETFDSTSGSSKSGGSRHGAGLVAATPPSSSSHAVSPPVASPPVVVAIGVTPVNQHKRSTFGVVDSFDS